MVSFTRSLRSRTLRVAVALTLLALMMPAYSCGSPQAMSVSSLRLGKIIGIIQLITSISNPLDVLSPSNFEAELHDLEGTLISTVTSGNITIDSNLKIHFTFEGVATGSYKIVLYYKTGSDRSAILTKTVYLDNGSGTTGGGGFGCGGSGGSEQTGNSITVQDEATIPAG